MSVQVVTERSDEPEKPNAPSGSMAGARASRTRPASPSSRSSRCHRLLDQRGAVSSLVGVRELDPIPRHMPVSFRDERARKVAVMLLREGAFAVATRLTVVCFRRDGRSSWWGTVRGVDRPRPDDEQWTSGTACAVLADRTERELLERTETA